MIRVRFLLLIHGPIGRKLHALAVDPDDLLVDSSFKRVDDCGTALDRLSGPQRVGTIAYMARADLIVDFKDVTPEGDIVEMRVWKVPDAVAPTRHGFKYRLFFGRAGRRIVGFDNERGKGDNRHLDGRESAYVFVDVDKLIEDFIAEVAKRRTP